MKTQKELLLESFSKLKVTSEDFYHCYCGDRFSDDTHTIDNYIDDNFAINVTFKETVVFDFEGWYDLHQFDITELQIWDAKTGDEIFIDVTDDELLNTLNY